jgi:Na+-driven multidrug efflux pump
LGLGFGVKQMKAKHKLLLAIDAGINFLLGLLLLLFPPGILELFGLPPTNTYFYASILGAVIFGIGIALLIELRGAGRGVRGLGLGGTIVINLCGACALVVWLLAGAFKLPIRGHIILWSVAIGVLGIGLAEIVISAWKYEGS